MQALELATAHSVDKFSDNFYLFFNSKKLFL